MPFCPRCKRTTRRKAPPPALPCSAGVAAIRAIPDAASSGGDGWSTAFYALVFIGFLFLLRHNPQLAFLLLDILLRSRGGSRFRSGRSDNHDDFRPGGGKFGGGGAG